MVALRRGGARPRSRPPDPDAAMIPFWSQIARELSPYVPGEQPRIANLVKLNTNESPIGPSPLALEAMRAAGQAELTRRAQAFSTGVVHLTYEPDR